MDHSGRKREPLGPLFPSSRQKGSRPRLSCTFNEQLSASGSRTYSQNKCEESTLPARDSVQINTLPSSKIYLNHVIDAVAAMRQRLDEEGYVPAEKTLSSPSSSDFSTAPVIETVNLKQLSEKTGTEFLKNFLCKVRIKNVEESDNWWYNCCNKNKCYEEMTKLDGKYKCFKCNRNYPLPQKKFKIVVLAEDETEAYNFVLLDRAAKRMIGKTAPKIIAQEIDGGAKKVFPTEIKNIKGKEVVLLIELNDDNILLHSTVYHATDAYDCANAISTRSDETTSVVGTSGSGENNVVDISENGNTPGSAKSCNKKIKKEK